MAIGNPPDAVMAEVQAQWPNNRVVGLVGTIAPYNRVSGFMQALQIHSPDAR